MERVSVATRGHGRKLHWEGKNQYLNIQGVVEKSWILHSLIFRLMLHFLNFMNRSSERFKSNFLFEEFDPSSGLTLAVCLTHASRAPRTMLIKFFCVRKKKFTHRIFIRLVEIFHFLPCKMFMIIVLGAADGRVTR